MKVTEATPQAVSITTLQCDKSIKLTKRRKSVKYQPDQNSRNVPITNILPYVLIYRLYINMKETE
jgi:hypothetical protein